MDDELRQVAERLNEIYGTALTERLVALVLNRWQPIATAPKDGTEILLGHGNSVWIDEWVKFEDGAACWMMCDQWSEPETPSHWMLLPEPPDNQQGAPTR